MFKRNQLVVVDIYTSYIIEGPFKVTYTNKEYFRIAGLNIKWSQKTHRPLNSGMVSNEIFYDHYAYYKQDVKIYSYTNSFKDKKEVYDKYIQTLKLVNYFEVNWIDLIKGLTCKNAKYKNKQLTNILENLQKVKSLWLKK